VPLACEPKHSPNSSAGCKWLSLMLIYFVAIRVAKISQRNNSLLLFPISRLSRPAELVPLSLANKQTCTHRRASFSRWYAHCKTQRGRYGQTRKPEPRVIAVPLRAASKQKLWNTDNADETASPWPAAPEAAAPALPQARGGRQGRHGFLFLLYPCQSVQSV
jgi:hypothetical protein